MVQVTPLSLFTLVFCLTLPTCCILRRCFVTLRADHKGASNQKCSPPPRYSQISLLLGLDVLRDLIVAAHSETYLTKIQHSYQQYGNTFSKHILFSSIICTIEPENIKAVLSTSFKDYGITDVRKDAFRPFLGQSILTTDGAEWTHARAMLRPSFSNNNHGDLEMFEVHVVNLLKAIRREGPVVNLKDLFLGLTADVTTHSMYGESVHSLKSGTLAGLMGAFHDAQYGCENRARWGKFALFMPQRKFYTSVKVLQQYVEKHVRKAIQSRKTQEIAARTAKTEERYVLLHELGKVIHNEARLRDELLTILFVGRDTTASLLCSLFLTVANRPDIWLRLRAEVDYFNGENPTLEQLKKMQYSKYCLNETLRLYPPLPHNARIAVKDTTLPVGGGSEGHCPIFIRAGTKVEFDASALHRRKDLWGEDAEEYRPERWERDIAPWQFLAFSGGPRHCIGQQFGFTLAQYTTVRLIQEFERLESRDPKPWTEHVGVVCFPANEVKVYMTNQHQTESV